MGTKIKKWMFPAAFAAVISTAAAVSAQVRDTAYVPFNVNVTANVKIVRGSSTVQENVTKNVPTTLAVPLSASGGDVGNPGTGVLNGAQGQLSAPAIVRSRNGSVFFTLSPRSYKNAEVSLHSVNGKLLMRGRASATEAAKSIVASGYLTAGVYLMSVKGSDGNTFSSRVTHRGGSLDIRAAFSSEADPPSRNLAKEAAANDGEVTVSASGYEDSTYTLALVKGTNPTQTITLRQAPAVPPTPPSNPTAKADYTEKVGSVSFDMIYIPGGTFTLGCDKENGEKCAVGSAPAVKDVKVSNYFIMKTEATEALWNAVMGKSGGSASSSYMKATWYDAMEFACKLSQKTGKNYRMMTEAEFEYAARNYKSKLQKIGDGSSIMGEEWAYNSWNADKHTGGTDPLGPKSGAHTQKTRRDANGTGESNVTSRLIRSIDGTGPSTRLVVSADVAYPSGYVPPCDLKPPHMDDSLYANSYRDPRWITGGEAMWDTGAIAIGNIQIRAWEDGTARLCTFMGCKDGQWFTSNNIAFVFVPSSGTPTKFAYIFLDTIQGTLISDKSFMNGGYVGRIEKVDTKPYAKPAISGLKSGEELAKAQPGFDTLYKMIDMKNIPASTQKQDARLFDEANPKANPSEGKKGWFQDNTSMSAAHHYRKDIDPDEFRFTVNQGNGRNLLAAGAWFTVNNTFLRVKHKNGYTVDYLYTIADDGTFYHNSFVGYERADFRMFKKETNGSDWPKTSCGEICSQEIPKGLTPGRQANDESTYQPAKCPAGGCK